MVEQTQHSGGHAAEKKRICVVAMHNCDMNDWDDLRFFLAAARASSSRQAARTLGVNQSTVARRIRQLEEDSGVSLFERRPHGIVLTDFGRELVVEAEQIEGAFSRVDRLILSHDDRPSGTIRFSVADGLLALVGPVVAEMGRAHPGVQVEVEVSNSLSRVSQLEADVVLRVASRPPDTLIGRRIGTLVGAPYASQTYVQQSPPDTPLAEHRWVRWAEPWRDFPVERWISAHVPPSCVKATVNSNQALMSLVAQGLGVGFLPSFAADADPQYVRLAPRVELGASIWLLTHDDLRRTGRIAAFMKVVGDALQAKRSAIQGPFPNAEQEAIVAADAMDTYEVVVS